MSATVLVTQARSSLPGGIPGVEVPRCLVRIFQFSLGIHFPPLFLLLLSICIIQCLPASRNAEIERRLDTALAKLSFGGRKPKGLRSPQHVISDTLKQS